MERSVLPNTKSTFTGKHIILSQLKIVASNHHGKCLSSDYKNIRQKLLWEYKKGHKWYTSACSILYSDSWCPYCAGNRKLSLIELQRLANQKGGRCLATYYLNSKTKLLWQCKNGHQWYATSFSIKTRESWCPVCYKNNLTFLKRQKSSKKSQDVLNTSLTDKLIQFKALDITKDLVKSFDIKIISTDRK